MSDTTRPKPPEHLADEALIEWDRVCDLLAAAGRLEPTDAPLIALYAESFAIYQDVMRHVRKHGAVVKWPNGTVGPSPFYKTSREVAGQMRAMLADLGLTPVNRAKVKAAKPAGANAEDGY